VERLLEHPFVSQDYKIKVKAIKEKQGIITFQENLEKAYDEFDYIVSKNFAVSSNV
jgi:hypothetical protein